MLLTCTSGVMLKCMLSLVTVVFRFSLQGNESAPIFPLW